MRDLYTRSPDIPGPLRSLPYKISSKDFDQDPTRRKYREGCADEIKIGAALQRERSDAPKLRRGLREPKQKNAPGWAPAAFHQQNERGATARAIRQAQSPERVAFANIKTGAAPQRDSKNQSSDGALTSEIQYETAPATKKWVRGIRRPVTATRNDVNVADPNSTTVSQNERFELSKTDFKSTKHCACHEKWRCFTTSNFEQPLRRFCTPFKTLTFCTFPFPKTDTARRREQKCKFSISRGTFHREGCQISRRRRRTPPIYTRCFSTTVRTP